MVYTSNSDVLYRRKKNPYKGLPSAGTGYGYGSLASTLLKSYVKGAGGKSNYSLKGKMKTRFKKGGTSMTKTSHSRSEADPLGGSVSKFSMVKPKVRLGNVEKLTEPQIVVTNGAGRLTSLIGKQEGGILLAEMTPVDVVSLFNNTFGTANKSTKGLIKSCVSEIMFTNTENVPLRYTLYDIIAKHDGNSTIVDPLTAFQTGNADPAGGSAASYLVPGVDPYMNPRFREYFHVVEQTTGTLLPGNVHTHKSYYECNRLISNEISTYTSSFIKGLTHYTMIIFHGTPENDSTTKTQVSISAANIDYVVKRKWTTKLVYYPFQSNSVTNSLALAFGVGGQILNEFTGVAQAEAAA